MANIRTLKLNLLADTTDFAHGIKKASGQAESFSGAVKSSMKSLAKSAALAGVAVAGMAVAFGVDAVKAAIEDQKSQKLLQKSLANTTKATDKQRKSVEKWITKQQFAYGVSDTKLRPNLAKLARTTGSLTKAQDLLSLAIDISAGSGRDLDSVTQALSRAQMGNLAGLKKLGIPLTDTIIKTKDLKAATEIAAKTYGGSAAVAADTFAGKMEIFKQRIDEAKESIGTKLLTVIQPLADKWLPKISQLVTDTIDGFMGKKGTRSGFSLGQAIRDVASAIGDLIAALNTSDDGKQKTFAENIQSIANSIQSLASAIERIARVIRSIKDVYSKVTDFLSFNIGGFHFDSPFSPPNVGGMWNQRPSERAKAPKSQFFNGVEYFWDAQKNKWYTTDISGGRDYSVQPNSTGPRNFRQRSMSPSGFGGAPVTINLNGIVDAESARRSIVGVLQQSSIRSAPVNVNGSLI